MCDHGGSGYRLYLGFLFVYRLSWSVFLVGVYSVGVVLRVSLSLWAVFFWGGGALSLVGNIAIHCIPLPAGTVLIGHFGTFVVTLSL